MCSIMAVDDEYQRGRLTEKVAEHDRRLNAINGSIDRAEAAINGLREEVARITVKVGIAAFIAGLVGSGITAVIVARI
jgi:hypothetical protein